MMVEILRPFESDGRTLERGEVVDASHWRLTRQLEALRYVAPVLAGASAAERPERHAAAVSGQRRADGRGRERTDG